MRKTLLDSWEEGQKDIRIIEERILDSFFDGNTPPKCFYECAWYEAIKEIQIVGYSARPGKMFTPGFSKKPTRKDLTELQSYKTALMLADKEATIYLDYKYTNGPYTCSGMFKFSEIVISNNKSFKKEDLEPVLLELKRKFEPKEGYIKCSYCGEQRLVVDIIYTTIFSPNWKDNGCESPKRPYCKDKPCAGHDQMAHEG